MGTEVVGSELPKMNGEVKSKLNEQEAGTINSSEGIMFGSHGVDELQTKGEEDNVSSANISKDNAADAWAEVQCHYFWFVKHRPLEDANLKAKIDNTEKEIQKYQQQISKLFEDIRVKSVNTKPFTYTFFQVQIASLVEICIYMFTKSCMRYLTVRWSIQKAH